MANIYDPKKIEPKWQKVWGESGIYKAEDFSTKPKWYSLIEFPYPSGDGLHTGHIRSNTAMDIISRKRRMEGFNVLYPIGWDAFGLPTENYAIKNGIHPSVVTKNNTDTFRKQLKSCGFSFDWDREINTTDPAYYKWTQWIFLQLFKKGLAYKQKTFINWCPKDKCGLANEEVIAGKCERCGTPVEKREKDQWMLAITKYADRLDKDLDKVDYLPQIKLQQRNWIGRSEGSEIDFELDTKYHYVLLHGYQGSPETNFFPWLKKELEKKGHSVEVPRLPNSENPDINEQIEYVLKNCQFDGNTILLGHSLGSPVALGVLEKLNKQIHKLVLAAGFMQPKFLDIERPFEKNFDWQFDVEKIKKSVQSIVYLRAKNDTAVPFERSDYMQQKLGGNIVDFTANDDHICGEIEPTVLDNCLDKISVFTTRADTLFGVTYVVLAPEHPLVTELKEKAENIDEIEAYIQKTLTETDTERTTETREKTGVELKGIKAINPANGEEVPVFIADYVLASYGTGAVMAVPAHDERDWAFAKKYNLPIREVVLPYLEHKTSPARPDVATVKRNNVDCYLLNPKTGQYAYMKWDAQFDWVTPPGGGINEGEDIIEAGKREIREETGYLNVKYISKIGECFGGGFATHKNENRFAHVTGLLFELVDDAKEEVAPEELEKHQVMWADKDEIASLLNTESSSYLWSLYLGGPKAFTGYGVLINSGKFDGQKSEDAMKAITEAVGGSWVTKYKLRDWVFSRQRYWGEPIPLVYCDKDGWVAVPEESLPVELPNIKNYEPSDDGESPLSRVPEWVNTTCPICGGPAKRETDTMPNWAGSSWYFLRYVDPKNTTSLADFKKQEYWSPVDWYNGGAEHINLHLLYSRFWNKFLYDIGIVPFDEPYKKRTLQGMILGGGGVKMSKSKGNVVNPDETIKNYGADTLRIYEMFMGPFDQSIAWSTESIIGSRRFLDKVWNIGQKVGDKPMDNSLDVLTNKTIKKVGEDIESMAFNTAISTMMVWANEADKVESIGKEAFESFLKLLAPFAPHVAEELWQALGNEKTIHLESWPKFDPSKLLSGEVTIVVQVGGKIRDSFEAPAGINQAEAEKIALSRDAITKWVGDKEVRKIIYIQDRLLNIVL